MDEERASPMMFVSLHYFFAISRTFLLPLIFVEQELGGNRSTRSFRSFTLIVNLSLPLDIFNRSLISGVHSTALFSRFRSQHLGLKRVSSRINHVSGERMLVNLHWLCWLCRDLELEPALLDGRLYLLTEDFALVGVVGRGIVPFAILHLFQLFGQWDRMIG